MNEKKTDIIITGLPRSGTSYLCRLLHTVKDCVVINEPKALFKRLADEYPQQIKELHNELRQNIINNQPIENKLHNGQVIEDTKIINQYELYHPNVSSDNFTICTKNTLGYMARLPQLQTILPHALFIACIRHPLDTIVSWKSTFPHLEHATVDKFPTGNLYDPFLSSWQKQTLETIYQEENLFKKRALLWNYLAEWLFKHKESVHILPYENTVKNPVEMLNTVFSFMSHNTITLTQPVEPSQARKNRTALTIEEKHIIEETCAETAAKFGYTNF